MVIIFVVQFFYAQKDGPGVGLRLSLQTDNSGAAVSPQKLHFQKRRIIWQFSSVKNVAQPRKAGANRKNAPSVLKPGPWQSRRARNRPTAAVRQRNKPRTAAPVGTFGRGRSFPSLPFTHLALHPCRTLAGTSPASFVSPPVYLTAGLFQYTFVLCPVFRKAVRLSLSFAVLVHVDP